MSSVGLHAAAVAPCKLSVDAAWELEEGPASACLYKFASFSNSAASACEQNIILYPLTQNTKITCQQLKLLCVNSKNIEHKKETQAVKRNPRGLCKKLNLHAMVEFSRSCYDIIRKGNQWLINNVAVKTIDYIEGLEKNMEFECDDVRVGIWYLRFVPSFLIELSCFNVVSIYLGYV